MLHTQGGALLTSLIIAVGSTVLSLLIAVPAAHALANFRFRVTGLVTLVLLVTQTIPGIVLGTSFFKIFADIHLLNSYLGLIIADSTYCVPFDILVIRAFMISLPHELLEAAYVDGATLLGSLVRIVLPLSRPAILAAALFSFLFSWGDFLFALTLNTSGNVIPISLSIYQYLGAVHLAVARPDGGSHLRGHPVRHPLGAGPEGDPRRDRHRRAQGLTKGT